MPYWFVFDLDETLAHVSPFHFLVCTFFQAEFATEVRRPNLAVPTPEPLVEPLTNAYRRFVELCAAQETSGNPVGILRPRVLDVFSKIAALKDAGIAGGAMIYSNNGTRKILEFIRDVIHASLGRTDLICDCIHLNDPRRGAEGAVKQFRTIKRILEGGPCAGGVVKSTDVFFVDDLVHPEISAYIGNRYMHVLPYKHRANADILLSMYLASLRDAGILTDPVLRPIFFHHVTRACVGPFDPNSGEDTFVEKLKINIRKTADGSPVDNHGMDYFLMRLDDLMPAGNHVAVPVVANAANNNGLGNNPLSAIQTGGRKRRKGTRRRKNLRKNRTWRQRRA